MNARQEDGAGAMHGKQDKDNAQYTRLIEECTQNSGYLVKLDEQKKLKLESSSLDPETQGYIRNFMLQQVE